MRRVLSAGILCLCLTGCVAVMPAQLTINEMFLAHPDTYEIKGPVEGTSTISWFLFFPMSKDAGYRAAYADALQKSGADGLINVVADVQQTNMILFHEVKTIVRGTAIKKK